MSDYCIVIIGEHAAGKAIKAIAALTHTIQTLQFAAPKQPQLQRKEIKITIERIAEPQDYYFEQEPKQKFRIVKSINPTNEVKYLKNKFHYKKQHR